MALIWSCGFEGMGDTDLLKYFNSTTDQSFWRVQSGRNNGKALTYVVPYTNQQSYLYKNILDTTPDKEFTFGFSFYTGSGSYGGDSFFIYFKQTALDNCIYIGYCPLNNNFSVNRANNNYACDVSCGNFSVPLNTWSYIEINFKLSNTNTGKIVVRLNGVTVINLTNINITINSKVLYLDNICFFMNSFTMMAANKLDDMYLIDNIGSYNNTFLGDVRIDMINPSAAGNYSQLSPSAGDNYQCVDEEAFSNTDFVQGSNVTDKDSYNYEDTPADLDDSNIYAVEINTLAKRTAAADNIKIKNLVRKSSTDYKDATAKSLPDTEFVLPTILERDPADASAWTKAKINSCEFGVELSS